jgi:hypothetical protein
MMRVSIEKLGHPGRGSVVRHARGCWVPEVGKRKERPEEPTVVMMRVEHR